jgi:hypothetical protein
MKLILSILACLLIFLFVGAAIGSDPNDENDGAWSYGCDVTEGGRAYQKYVNADDRIEAEYKVRAWGARQSPPRKIDSVACNCRGEAGCE